MPTEKRRYAKTALAKNKNKVIGTENGANAKAIDTAQAICRLGQER